MPHRPRPDPNLEAFNKRIGPDDPGREALANRLIEIQELQERGDPAFQQGSKFFETKTGQFVESVIGHPFLEPDGGGAALSFAQTGAGARLAASLARETERIRGRERLKLENTLFELAKELLPPKDVETAMLQVRRGELVKSKLAFQAVLENLADAERNAERRRDLELAEENEKRTLTAARSQIVINMIGKDLGRAVLFALSGSTSANGGGE